MSVYIIAEAGVNHNGSLSIAKKMVDEAKDTGVNCIKFQTFVSDNIVSKYATKADYQQKNTDKNENQLDMLKKLELSFEEFQELNDYCEELEIDFMSTAFDFDSIRFLNSLGMKKWKIPSGDITNLPYLIKIAKLNKPIIISTGMSTMEDIDSALKVVKKHSTNTVAVLHCTTEYPAPYDEVNLSAMNSIKEHFNIPIGYSDHTKGIEIPIAAVSLGATVIEKHFTLDKNMEGPDHQASIDPLELKEMVSAIRNVEKSIGDGIKKPMDSEVKNMINARKSIIANTNIKKGEIFTENNLTVKRPGNGMSPMKWFDIIGNKATKDFKQDELIDL